MSEKRGSSVAKLIGNKIFIVLLAFSVAIIFISLAFNRSIKKVSVENEEYSEELPVTTDTSDAAEEYVFDEYTEAEETFEEDEAEEAITYRLPVAGELQKEFSKEELLWNETMQDWRTHNGVDIEAEEGAEVVTAAPGTVMEAYKDEMCGFTVKVSHSDGTITVYKNLGKTVVEKDDILDEGQMIGTVGSTGAFEMMQKPHLHFEVVLEGKHVNPLEFIK